ncbi:hypothetical protein ACFQY4_29565 [Catellatospora bangladeshensis]|uniref:hypothetical protein n=1 Tax=Catellatospora bangladeshensis TaxID=310355 RepID=UPI003614DC22
MYAQHEHLGDHFAALRVGDQAGLGRALRGPRGGGVALTGGQVPVGCAADVVPGPGVFGGAFPGQFHGLDREHLAERLLDSPDQDLGGLAAGLALALVDGDQVDAALLQFVLDLGVVVHDAGQPFGAFADDQVEGAVLAACLLDHLVHAAVALVGDVETGQEFVGTLAPVVELHAPGLDVDEDPGDDHQRQDPFLAVVELPIDRPGDVLQLAVGHPEQKRDVDHLAGHQGRDARPGGGVGVGARTEDIRAQGWVFFFRLAVHASTSLRIICAVGFVRRVRRPWRSPRPSRGQRRSRRPRCEAGRVLSSRRCCRGWLSMPGPP